MTRGFTLIEIVMYVLIVGLIMGTLGSFVGTMLQTRAKTLASSDVITTARQIQDALGRAARHAQTVNVGASTFGTDPGVLSFSMVDAAIDPTVFSLTSDDGQFQVSEAGGGTTVTSDDVRVTNLVFVNLTGAQDAGIIQVQFTLEAANDSGSAYFDYAQTFQTTLRIPLN